VQLHGPVSHCKANPGAFVLSCKEELEDFGFHFSRDTRTLIRDGKFYVSLDLFERDVEKSSGLGGGSSHGIDSVYDDI